MCGQLTYMSFLDKLSAQIPFNNKPEKAEYFFAVDIGLSEVKAVVWEVSGANVNIVGQAVISYQDNDDLIEKTYQVLDQSLGVLEIEPSKVLFGVPDSWVLDDNLKEPYLKLLRRILKETDLSPIAYVSTASAIAYYLQKQEGTPPTAILIGVGDSVELTLLRGGKVTESRVVKRSDQLFDDIGKTSQSLQDVDVLPAKIMVYSTKAQEDIDKIKDELMSYPWMQRLSFLHFPKIEVLDEETPIQSVVLAGAIEVNPQIDLKHSFSAVSKTKSLLSPGKHLDLGPSQEENLGFVRGDIKEQERSAEDVANIKERVFRKKRPDGFSGEEGFQETALSTSFGREVQEWEEDAGDLGKKVFPAAFLAKLTKFFKFPKKGNMSGLTLAKIAIVPVVLIAFLAGWLFLVKATVTIYVEPRSMDKATEVVADPKVSAVDETRKIIPGALVETTISGSGKASATGKKDIGDPAKGKVIIYNKTNARKSLSSGTALTGPGNIKFTLEASVNIASQSATTGADESTIITPGKSDLVGATAVVIGPDGNLPAGTTLTVGGFAQSDVVAKIDEAFSGGTSKTVTVVTSDDQKKLQAQVLDDLKQKATEDLKGKVKDGNKIIPDALAVVDGKYSFNKKVNDQANEFSLDATVRFKGTSYSDADLRTIVAKLVEIDVPSNYTIDLLGSETRVDVDKVDKDGKVTFNAAFKAKLIPKLNTDDLRRQLKGKNAAQVAELLKGMENIVGSDIKFSPNLPGPLTRLPFVDKNITILVAPK